MKKWRRKYPDYNKQYHAQNRAKKKQSIARCHVSIKRQAFSVVANGKPIKCIKHQEWDCCADPYNTHILSLDHINGDGHKHRRLITTDMYSWVVKNKGEAQKMLQILCYNAQRIKMYRNKESRKK